MSILTVVYLLVAVALSLYGLYVLISLVAATIVIVSAKTWEVDPKDPTLKGGKGVIRQLEPFDFVAVGKAGSPVFPVVRQTAARLSMFGLQTDGGLEKNNVKHWDVIKVRDEDDESGAEKQEYKPHIQSPFGWLDPIFIFRKIVYEVTGRHVVRVWLPFFLFGFYELYAPVTMTFVRARAKTISSGDVEARATRPSMKVLDVVDDSTMEIVEDVTDHVLYEFPLRVITDTMPTRDGYSLRSDVTLVLRLKNLHKVVSWKDWSSQIRSVVADTSGRYFRKGTLDMVYASSEEGTETLQKEIKTALTDGKKYTFKIEKYTFKTEKGGAEEKEVKISVMEALGFECLNVMLNDLIPGDKNSKQKIEEIMSIVAEGRSRASAAGALIKAQAEALNGVDSQTKSTLSTLTAAQNSKGKIDFIIGADRGDATLAVQNRVAKNTTKEE